MIAKYIEYLQIFKFSLLIRTPSEIGDDLLEGTYLVITDGEDVELGAIMKTIQYHYLIVVEGKISKVHQIIKSLYDWYLIETEIQPFEIRKVPDIFNLFYDVIVQLQLLEASESIQILDLQYI